jgi:hypothetical protein
VSYTVYFCVPHRTLLRPTKYCTVSFTLFYRASYGVSYRILDSTSHSILQIVLLCPTQYLTEYPVSNTVSYRVSCVQHSISQSILCPTQYLTEYPVSNTLSHRASRVQHSILQSIPCPTQYLTEYPLSNTVSYRVSCVQYSI